MSESGGFFQILTHENYEQLNGIQLEVFYKSPMQGILQQTEGLRHKLHQIPEKKKLKKVKIWSFMNVESNNLLTDIHRHKLI